MNRSTHTAIRIQDLSRRLEPIILAFMVMVAAPWFSFFLVLQQPGTLLPLFQNENLYNALHANGNLAFTFTSNTGTITGTVTDEKEAPLAGVNVLVQGTIRGAVTSPDGKYLVTGIPEGTFTIRFSCMGYKTVETTGVRVTADQSTRVNAKLVVMAIEQFECVIAAEVLVAPRSMTSSLGIVSHSSFKTSPEPQTPSLSLGGTEIARYRINEAAIANITNGELTPGQQPDYDREGYSHIVENEFKEALTNPLSTFSIDVDAASYSNLRRILNDKRLPPPDAVRIEEMVNYFSYEYEEPDDDEPFSITTEISECPWKPSHKLLLIGLQGKKIDVEDLPPSNLVFLLDVSGSMDEPDKLPLVKAAFRLLAQQLREEDRVSIVVYAGRAGLVLPSTTGDKKQRIIDALENLRAGGSTAGGEGITLAYAVAKENFLKNGNNRVILATDGDFNVGISSDGDLVRLIEEKRKEGIFLSVVGFGTGNYQDSKMQQLADKGNGNHSYVDNILEAKKVFVSQMAGTLFTIAKDVKLQIEFNPATIKAYRLIGYENRMLAKEDFNDDTKDAGELGAGHTVTALYELVLAGENIELPSVDPLKYQRTMVEEETETSDELLTIKLRHKLPEDTISKLIVHPLENEEESFENASENFRFASSVAEFGLLLRNSAHRNIASYNNVLIRAKGAKGKDKEGYRAEFIRLVETAQLMQNQAKHDFKE